MTAVSSKSTDPDSTDSTDSTGTDSTGSTGTDLQFVDVQDTKDRLNAGGYLADDALATTVFLQTRLDKPLLIEGPAGVGKTQLASSLAQVTGRRLLRLQCYEGQDESKALYEWDYGKQLLYTQILREKITELVGDTRTIDEAVDRIANHDSVFFSERFLAQRPLLEAVLSPDPVVLLIDEVDRADEALEAVLLELLAEFQISIPEVGTVRAKHQPYVILTSNNTRDLSAALKRRCLHLFLDYPDAERELDIIRSKDTGLDDALASQLVEVVRGLRELDLRKAPSISETIDWARTLAVLGASELSSKVLSDTLNIVVKYERDVSEARKATTTTTTRMGITTTTTRMGITTTITLPTCPIRTVPPCGRRRTSRAATARASTAIRVVTPAARPAVGPSDRGAPCRVPSTGSSGCCGCSGCGSASRRPSTRCRQRPNRACWATASCWSPRCA